MQKHLNLVRGFERLQHYTVSFLRSVIGMKKLSSNSFQGRQLDVACNNQMGDLAVLLVPISLIGTCHGHQTQKGIQLHGEVNEDHQNEETDVNLARFVLGGNITVPDRRHGHKGRIKGRKVVKLYFAVQILKHHEKAGGKVDQIKDCSEDFKSLLCHLVFFGVDDQIQQTDRLFDSQKTTGSKHTK